MDIFNSYNPNLNCINNSHCFALDLTQIVQNHSCIWFRASVCAAQALSVKGVVLCCLVKEGHSNQALPLTSKALAIISLEFPVKMLNILVRFYLLKGVRGDFVRVDLNHWS